MNQKFLDGFYLVFADANQTQATFAREVELTTDHPTGTSIVSVAHLLCFSFVIIRVISHSPSISILLSFLRTRGPVRVPCLIQYAISLGQGADNHAVITDLWMEPHSGFFRWTVDNPSDETLTLCRLQQSKQVESYRDVFIPRPLSFSDDFLEDEDGDVPTSSSSESEGDDDHSSDSEDSEFAEGEAKVKARQEGASGETSDAESDSLDLSSSYGSGSSPTRTEKPLKPLLSAAHRKRLRRNRRESGQTDERWTSRSSSSNHSSWLDHMCNVKRASLQVCLCSFAPLELSFLYSVTFFSLGFVSFVRFFGSFCAC